MLHWEAKDRSRHELKEDNARIIIIFSFFFYSHQVVDEVEAISNEEFRKLEDKLKE